MAAHETVEIPSSKLKQEMARILTEQGYIEGFEVVPGEPGKAGDRILVKLKYTESRESVISGLKRISRPGQRTYVDSKSMPEGARRHGHRDRVHLAWRDDRPRRPQGGRRRRARRADLVARHVSYRKEAHPRPHRRQRDDRARGGSRRRPARRSPGAQEPRHRGPPGGRGAPRHPPDRPRGASRAARAHALADREHGHRRHRRLHQDARDPGRRLPRAAQGLRPRARPRLLAPGADQGAGWASSSRCRSRPA